MMRHVDHHNGAILLGSVLLLFSIAGLLGAPRIALPPTSPVARLLGAVFGYSGAIGNSGAIGDGGAIGNGGGNPESAFNAAGLPAASPTPARRSSPTPFQPDITMPEPTLQVVPSEEVTGAISNGAAIGNGGAVRDGSDINGGEVGDGSFLVPHVAQATPTLPSQPLVPERIAIPAVQLDALVLAANYRLINDSGQVFQQWEAPALYAAGWQTSSAMLGVPGNTVLNGHHNVHGSVFGRLADLQDGDLIQIYSGGERFDYAVTQKMILEEQGMPLGVRLENARWLQSSQDERLTLVTCWPEWTNSHRLIIVARPIGRAQQ